MKLQADMERRMETGKLQVQFSVEKQVLGILGRSGCGKSMTLRCLAGILTPDRGRITLDEEVLFDSERKICQKPQKRRIGYLFQNYALFPNMTVRENICFSLKRRDKQGKRYAEELIERFYLAEVANVHPRVLSGGQQQRTALARMLAARPKVLLLDEPFSALDSFLRYEMEKELQEVLREFDGVSILVSHDQEEIRRLTDVCMVMENGKIVERDDTERLFAQPQSEEAKRLLLADRRRHTKESAD